MKVLLLEALGIVTEANQSPEIKINFTNITRKLGMLSMTVTLQNKNKAVANQKVKQPTDFKQINVGL